MICAPGADGGYAGFTANSFNSVSLDPPLIVWSLAIPRIETAIIKSRFATELAGLGVPQVEAFIRDAKPSPLPFSEALPAHRLVDAIYASADRGGAVVATR